MSLIDHLKTGSTTVCRAWQVRRQDGRILGFTDHDEDLQFDGVTFLARTGFTSSALQQTTGLSVDNTEAVGALSDDAISEIDIQAGRFDNAEVIIFLVNWQDVTERKILFKGSFGEITRKKGEFHVELRSFSEALNRPTGNVIQPECSAVLGDMRCKVDVESPAFRLECEIVGVDEGAALSLLGGQSFPKNWFSHGTAVAVSGIAYGLRAVVKSDHPTELGRSLEFLRNFPILPEVGDRLILTAGCDHRASTCKSKFSNFLNFRGFPHVPGNDWLRAAPKARASTSGQ
jgi:uncharacterized phage protein (TIGR02218 family)